jgi:hypothetical protein
LEGSATILATGPVTPVDGPMTSRTRRYVRRPPSAEALATALEHGPAIRVTVSHAASFPPEWFEGLTGAPVDISGADGYRRANDDRISLVVLHEPWVVTVSTVGVAESDVLSVARSLDLG